MNIPKYAKKVFKGIIFDVYQWPQKMFDGSVATFEVIRRQNTVIVIPTVKDKIVAIKQKQPGTSWFYCTPSGRMDIPGETPKAAALRELLEETGMVPKKMFLWKKVARKGKLISNIYFYIARDCLAVSLQKLDSGEKILVELMSFKDYIKLAESNQQHLEESYIDMLKAKYDKKYRSYLKKVIFG